MSVNQASMRRQTDRPWGRAVGLLTGCAVTLIGVVNGLSPSVIAVRAICSGCLIGVIAAAAAAFLLHSSDEGEDQ